MTEDYVKNSPTGAWLKTGAVEEFAGPNAYEGVAVPAADVNVLWVDNLTGVKNPKWREQIGLLQNAGTPMSARKKTITSVPAYIEMMANVHSPGYLPGRRKVVWQGLVGADPSIYVDATSAPVGNAANQAAGAWYQQVRNKMVGFKGATFVAESRQAKRMIFERGTKMLDMIPRYQARLLKRWQSKRTRRAKLKALSDSWLELQFGWLPLASDIEDLIDTLNKPTPEFQRVTAQGTHTEEDPNYRTFGEEAVGIGRYRYEAHAVGKYQVRYKGLLKAKPTDAHRKDDFGVGVREWLPTIWEVVPWSFAIDYFTNIDKIVTSASYANVEFVWTNRTHRWQMTYTHSGHAYFANSSFPDLCEEKVAVEIPGHLEIKSSRVQRIPDVSVPIPRFYFKLPSAKQSLNLAALAVSRRMRLRF